MGLLRKKRDHEPRRRRVEKGELDKRKEQGKQLFRRGRTLTGSESSNIGSANELNASLRSPRAQGHHLVAHRRYLGGMFAIFILSAMILFWFLYEFTAGINVNASNASSAVLKSNRYERAITEYLAFRPFERVRTLIDHVELSNYMKSAAPEVDGVKSVRSGGFATTRFELVFRRPVASWLIGGERYYVDKTGVPFRINYFDEPKVKIVDNSGVPQIAGTAIASSNFLRFVGLAVDTSSTFDLQVTQAIIPEGTTRQIELRLSKKKYPVKLSLDRPVGEQIEDMKRAVDYLKKKGITPKYVDVRVSGRAYYK